MKIAVLMSTYNGEKYLEEQIESILGQVGDFELDLWVRDDGSSDGTHQILRAYEKEKKLHWYTGENLKPAHSFLDLVKHCAGYDFYAFADQDDWWFPGKLQSGIRAISQAQGPAVSFANAMLVDGDLASLNKNVYSRQPSYDFFTLSCAGGVLGCTIVFNSALARLIQSRQTPASLVMHDFYVSQLCALFDGQICYDSRVQMKYRQHGNNVVGVSVGKLSALKKRFHSITTRRKVSVSQQARSLLECYPQTPNAEKRQWLEQLAAYSDTFLNRLKLACSRRTHYPSFNMSLSMRLAILLGNQ